MEVVFRSSESSAKRSTSGPISSATGMSCSRPSFCGGAKAPTNGSAFRWCCTTTTAGRAHRSAAGSCAAIPLSHVKAFAVDVVADIRAAPKLESDELWFKDAIIYQLHVKAFADSNNDGIGDFAGLTEKLDYLKDLGVTALWLLPFYPSPGRDDGYDISDYRTINADFGTMSDFRRFMQEARR